MKQICDNCEEDVERPLPENANYAVSQRFTEQREREKHVALVHTDATKRRLNKMDRLFPDRDRQAIAAEMAHPEAPSTIEVNAGQKRVENEGGGWTETADKRTKDYSIPISEFEHIELGTPDAINDDRVALVLTSTELTDEPRTVLLHPRCTEDGDEILWGPDT